jgi:hypothetical protein
MRTHRPFEPANALDDLLEAHLRTVQEQLIKTKGENPVGFVIDGTDEFGREAITFLLSKSKGITEQEAEAVIDANSVGNLGPAFVCANDGPYTLVLLLTLARMNPAAGELLDQVRYHRPENEYLVVVIAAGGFGCYQVPSGLVSDGQNRTAIR